MRRAPQQGRRREHGEVRFDDDDEGRLPGAIGPLICAARDRFGLNRRPLLAITLRNACSKRPVTWFALRCFVGEGSEVADFDGCGSRARRIGRPTRSCCGLPKARHLAGDKRSMQASYSGGPTPSRRAGAPLECPSRVLDGAPMSSSLRADSRTSDGGAPYCRRKVRLK